MEFLNRYMNDYSRSRRWEFLFYGIVIGIVIGIIAGKIL
jgi:hypothetical protein